MTDNTNTITFSNPPMPPTVLSGQELYDMIMGSIESDLVSTNVDSLSEKYTTQSPEERAERAERYRQAFDEYDRRFAEYQRQWNEQLHTYKRQAISFIEHESHTNETSQLLDIESSINI